MTRLRKPGRGVWRFAALIVGGVVVIHCVGIVVVTIGAARLLSASLGSASVHLPAILAGAIMASAAAWLSLALVGIAGLALLLRSQPRAG